MAGVMDWLNSLMSGGNGSSSSGGSNLPAGTQLLPNYGPTLNGNPLNTSSLVDASGNGITGGTGAMGTGSAATSNASTPFGPNLGTGQLAFSGLQTLGNLWNAYQSGQMASKTFDFTKNLANTNLANQTQAYNTNLAGQATARYAQENNPGGAAGYIKANQLPTKTL